MVNLTRIYTRTGDAGQTRLSDMSLAAKTDLRVEAYGHVDEANSVIGIALATLGGLPDAVAAGPARGPERAVRRRRRPVQPGGRRTPSGSRCASIQASIDRLEAWCDEFGEPLPALRSFILPGGHAGGRLPAPRPHRRPPRRARRLGRRPRRTASAAGTERRARRRQPAGAHLPEPALRPAVHRGRVANGPVGDVLWVPGQGPRAGRRRARAASATGSSGRAGPDAGGRRLRRGSRGRPSNA